MGELRGPGPCITALNSVLHWPWDSYFFGDFGGSAFLLTPFNSWLLSTKPGHEKNGVLRFPTALTWLKMMEWQQKERESGVWANSTSQLMCRGALGWCRAAPGMLLFMPGAIKGRRSTGSPLAQAQHSLPQTAALAAKCEWEAALTTGGQLRSLSLLVFWDFFF